MSDDVNKKMTWVKWVLVEQDNAILSFLSTSQNSKVGANKKSEEFIEQCMIKFHQLCDKSYDNGKLSLEEYEMSKNRTTSSYVTRKNEGVREIKIFECKLYMCTYFNLNFKL